jgi:hypothetical protein
MWLTVRLVALAIAFVSGCLFDPMGDFLEELDVPALQVLPEGTLPLALWILVVAAACATPPIVLAVVGVQVVNPLNTATFHKPGWRTNFVDVRDPGQFIHLFGYVLIAAGIGRAAADLATAGAPGHSAVGWILGGAGFLLGVRLCMRVYRSHYETDSQPQTDAGTPSR